MASTGDSSVVVCPLPAALGWAHMMMLSIRAARPAMAAIHEQGAVCPQVPHAARHVVTIHTMDPDELRDLCLSFPGAAETFPFGPENSVFKVAGKIFALSRLSASPLRVSLKCEPVLAEQLRQAHAAVLPGYHLNKRHWNTVIVDGSLPDETIRDMVEDSYDLVVSRLPVVRRRALRWRGNALRGSVDRPGRDL